MEVCTISCNTTEAFENIQKVCFKHKVYWISGSKSTKSNLNATTGVPHYIKITNSWGSNLTLSMYDQERIDRCTEIKHYTYLEFLKKYNIPSGGDVMIKTKYRFKTELEFYLEFGSDWREELDSGWLHSMDRYFGKNLSSAHNIKIRTDNSYMDKNECIVNVEMLCSVDKVKPHYRICNASELRDRVLSGGLVPYKCDEIENEGLDGTPLSDKTTIEILKDGFAYMCDATIYKDAIIEIYERITLRPPKTTQKGIFNKIEQLISPFNDEPVKLNNSLYSTETLKLNQNF